MRVQNRSAQPRRGVALVAVIVLLLVTGLIIVGMVLGGSRDQHLVTQRVDSVRAFYAAEGGMQMALREIYVRCDDDNDGVIGTISDNGSGADDPSIGGARVLVTDIVVGSTTTRTSTGRANDARRTIDARFE
jgi:Tfp pilus assembly protein PilX